MISLRRSVVAALVVSALGAGSLGALSEAATGNEATRPGTTGLERALAGTAQLPAPRTPGTADRYAPANGCFALKSAQSGKLVTRTADGFAATGGRGEPFRFQAFDLGKYLLFGSKKDFLATADQPLPTREAALVIKGYIAGTGDERVGAVKPPLNTVVDAGFGAIETATAPVVAQIRGDGIQAAAAPSASAEWVLKSVGRSFVLQQGYNDGDPGDPGVLDPPISATLTSSSAGVLAAATGKVTSKAAQFSLVRTGGCAVWPTAANTVRGPIAKGATSFSQTKGYYDAHLHLMAFEFIGGKIRCGRPWHPYGISYAMVDCADHGPGGYGSVAEDLLSGNDPGAGHDTVGWPSFKSWPDEDSLTHEAIYYEWLERAWRGGLRMFTNLLVDNEQLCDIYPLKKNSCNEMDGVRLQAKRTRQLERFIDAQSGGPQRGWFRIVTDPLQARSVINSGRLAVILGIEISRTLDCREFLGTASCTAADIDRRLTEVYNLGVRQMEMANKYDNALTGVTGDSGTNGVVVSAGNLGETGHFWKMTACPKSLKPEQHDKNQYDVADESGGTVGRDEIFGTILTMTGATGVAPVYAGGNLCNAVGLSSLGVSFIDGLIKRGMIFDPDHMSAIARQQALDHIAKRRYSGVMSSHSWSDDVNYFRILSLGGIVAPHAGQSGSFLGKWAKLRAKADKRFLYGIGWGSDVNGFSHQHSPRNPAKGKGVTYPFKGLGGTTIDKGRTGTRVWDINTDGLNSYGQYPDWVQDVKVQAGKNAATFTRDLENGVEAYLQMWERASGIAGDSCRSDIPDLTRGDLKQLKRGMSAYRVLLALGQPHTRVGTTYTYCGPQKRTVKISFTKAGALTRVA
jgi:hypothetical protein